MGSSPSQVKPKTIKLIFAAFLLSMQQKEVKSKDWFAWNQNNMSEWSNHGLSFHCKNPTNHVLLVQSGHLH